MASAAVFPLDAAASFQSKIHVQPPAIGQTEVCDYNVTREAFLWENGNEGSHMTIFHDSNDNMPPSYPVPYAPPTYAHPALSARNTLPFPSLPSTLLSPFTLHHPTRTTHRAQLNAWTYSDSTGSHLLA